MTLSGSLYPSAGIPLMSEDAHGYRLTHMLLWLVSLWAFAVRLMIELLVVFIITRDLLALAMGAAT